MNRTLIVSALTTALVAQLAPAQSPALQPAAKVHAGFVALGEDEGVLWGLGADYRARFLADGVVFNPVLGKGEPETRRLELRLTAAGRQNRVAGVAAARARHVDDLRVTYDRGAIAEVYDVRPDGLKQSFVFETTPAGSGDLVVRCALDTNMMLGAAASDGIRFDGVHGGVTIGEVVGFDAVGNRTTGVLALDGTTLEMRLPAAFVATATAPITVDPLIGSTTLVAQIEDYDPDVSYDATNDVWLTVWYTEVSSTDVDIRAQRVGSNGSLVGNGIGIRTGSNFSIGPVVGNNNSRDMFVVSWAEDDGVGTPARDIFARTVAASNGALGSTVTVSPSGQDDREVAIGGNRGTGTSNADRRVCLAWSRSDSPSAHLHAAALNVNADGSLTVATRRMVGFGGYNSLGATVSDAVDGNLNWWIVWDSYHIDWANNTYESNGRRDIYASYTDTLLNNQLGGSVPRLVDGDADASNQGGLFWYGNGGGHFEDCSIAGNGTDWIVAFAGRPVQSSNTQILAASMRLSERHSTIDFPYNWRSIANKTGEQSRPEAAVTADSVLIAYMDNEGNGSRNPWLWEGDFDADSATSDTQVSTSDDCVHVALSTKTEGGNSVTDGEVSLVVFSRDDGTNETIRAKRFRSDDGIVTNLGGACSGGGSNNHYAQAAMVGNGNHTIVMANALANTSVGLVLGFDERTSGCGSCSLKINAFDAWYFAKSTGALGNVRHDLAIPNAPALSGLSYLYQWLVFDSFSPGCAVVGADMTDAFRVTIQ